MASEAMDAGDKGAPHRDFWLFGYGLIWKPPPHFDERVPGYIKGYVRRFWQARCGPFLPLGQLIPKIDNMNSEDHRGTPSAPGRVVTLIERSFWQSLNDSQQSRTGDRVWGSAYHIIPEKVREVQGYLDIREINGYSIQYTPFRPADPERDDINCMVYIGMPDNPQFLGALDPGDVARRINESIGPSGENREYLLQLEQSLLSLSPEAGDAHISNLAQRVRRMRPPVRNPRDDMVSGPPSYKVSSSTEEQEEIEKDS